MERGRAVMKKQFIYKKNISLLLLMCMAVTFLFSVIFIDLHTSHECTGHFCTTCENLNYACKFIKQMGMSVKTISAVPLISAVFLMYSLPVLYSLKKHITLVSLKVRLDD